MGKQSLLEKGRAASARGEYYAALASLLELRDQGLDLVESWSLTRGINRLQLRDLNYDRCLEVGALSADGSLSFYLLQGKPGQFAELQDRPVEQFRFFRHIGEKPAVVVLRPHKILGVYEFEKRGTETRIRHIRNVALPKEFGNILDIAYKPHSIYLSFSSGHLCEYNKVNFDLRTHVINGVVQRFKTGGRLAEDASSVAYECLLGILQGGGLVIFDLHRGDLVETRRISTEEVYVDAYLADADSDGIEDIVAITRDGKIHIFDWYSLRLKFFISCPDEFYCLYCNDIDNDGILEILVGAQSNQFYSFAVSGDRGLFVKKQYVTAHRVLDIWAGTVIEDDKRVDTRVIVGEADGSLRVFRAYPAREIRTEISNAFRQLCTAEPQDFQSRLAGSNHLEVLRYALEQLAPQMLSASLTAFLDAIAAKGGYQAQLLITNALPAHLKKLQNDEMLADYAATFFTTLFETHHDLRTCQAICAALNEIVSHGVGISLELLALYDSFNRERMLMEGTWPQRLEAIRAHIGRGQFDDAYTELGRLKATGLDLLRYIRTGEAVRYLVTTANRIGFTTADRCVNLVDLQEECEVVSRRLAGGNLRYCALPYTEAAHIVSHGAEMEIYDGEGNVLAHKGYTAAICALGAFANGSRTNIVVGLADGGIVWENSDGCCFNFAVLTLPVAFAQCQRGDVRDLYCVTVDCRLYVVKDIVRHFQDANPPSTPLVAAPVCMGLINPINPLALTALQEDIESIRLIILCPDRLLLVKVFAERYEASSVILGRSATCAIIHRDFDGGNVEVIVGTRDRSLLYVALDGTVLKEAYLPDVPTSMHLVGGEQSSRLLVGFAAGNIGVYQLITHKDLQDLESMCDANIDRHHRARWQADSLAEKLALLNIAGIGECELDDIHYALEERVRMLIPKETIVTAVKALESKGTVHGLVKGPTVRYSVTDKLYARWIHSRQDLYSTIRGHRDEVIAYMKLADVRLIATSFPDTKEWLRDFLLIEQPKYERLVALSALMDHRTTANSDERETLRLKELQHICSLIDAVVLNSVSTAPGLSRDLSVFEIALPAVKFLGFDRLLVIILSTKQPISAPTLAWLQTLLGWKIILVLVSHHSDLVRDSVKSVSHVAVLDDDDLKNILISDSPRDEFFNRVLRQIDLATLSPFHCYGPVPDQFYGRASERQTLFESLQHRNKSHYAVIGPRKIGKTSLLLRVKRDLETAGGLSAKFIDLSLCRDPHAAFEALADALQLSKGYSSPEALIRQVEMYSKAQKYPPALLIDEVDGVLSSDRRAGEVFAGTLRTLVNQLGVRIVIAGYEAIYHQMHDLNSVMFNTFTPLELGALRPQDAAALVEESFRPIISIERLEVEHIIKQTACYPNFIQLCCHQLLKESTVTALRRIQYSDVRRVLESPDLYSMMARVYIEGLSEQCKVLLYIMIASYDSRLGAIIIDGVGYKDAMTSQFAQERDKFRLGESFTPYDLHRLLELHNVKLTHDELLMLIRRLSLGSVLRHVQGKEYSFVLPHLPQLLAANAEVELAATNLLERLNEIFGHRSGII